MAVECSIEGCHRRHLARGWCSGHYTRWARTGDPLTPLTRQHQVGECSAQECDRSATSNGLCASHDTMMRRYGTVDREPKWKRAENPDGRCWVCGAAQLKSGSRRYCSAACQQLASRARRAGLAAVPAVVTCNMCARPIDLLAPGVSRTGGPSTRKRRADSALCTDCERDRRHRHKFSTHALAARDGTRCGICDHDVDMDRRLPDPLSPSVDHVVACADGGSDEPSNLQLAHLTCNQRKNRRSNWTTRPRSASEGGQPCQ